VVHLPNLDKPISSLITPLPHLNLQLFSIKNQKVTLLTTPCYCKISNLHECIVPLCFNCSSCQKVHQNSKGEKKIQNLICLQNDFWENGYRFAKGISDYCNFVKLLYFQIFQKMTELEEVLADLQEAYERIDQDDYYIIESEERNYKLKMELEKLKEIFTRVSKDRATVEAELEEVKTEL
jgi:hypothetical protein